MLIVINFTRKKERNKLSGFGYIVLAHNQVVDDVNRVLVRFSMVIRCLLNGKLIVATHNDHNLW